MRTRSHYMTRRAYTIQQRVEETRPKLRRAFQALRKIGIYARMNYLCCGSCASLACVEELKRKPRWRGYVFWHAQSEERFLLSGQMHLGWGARAEDERELGKEIVAELTRFGILVTWEGSSMDCIYVKARKDFPKSTQLVLDLERGEAQC